MSLCPETASLFDALQQNPHPSLVYQTSDGIQHLLLHNQWDGWFTPCRLSLSAHEARLFNVHRGRPTCFECFADEGLSNEGLETRFVFKLHARRDGWHWRATLFAGYPHASFINIGSVCLLDFEWRLFAAVLLVGAMSLGMRVVIEYEGLHEKEDR